MAKLLSKAIARTYGGTNFPYPFYFFQLSQNCPGHCGRAVFSRIGFRLGRLVTEGFKMNLADPVEILLVVALQRRLFQHFTAPSNELFARLKVFG